MRQSFDRLPVVEGDLEYARRSAVVTGIGYFLSSEEFGLHAQVERAKMAEEAGS